MDLGEEDVRTGRDGSVSRSCPMAGVGINGVENDVDVTRSPVSSRTGWLVGRLVGRVGGLLFDGLIFRFVASFLELFLGCYVGSLVYHTAA